MEYQKIVVLGSAAAEGIPAIFCDCETCHAAWKNGGKDFRMRTSYQLGEFVRVDFGPDAMVQEMRFRLHSEKLRHIIVTHSHEDHLDTTLFAYRKHCFSKVAPDNTLNIYGGAGVVRKMNQFAWQSGKNIGFHGDFSCLQMKVHELYPFEKMELPDVDMTIYPFKADHMMSVATEEPFIYIIRWKEKYFMIANDTGFFSDETWEHLAQMKVKLSAVFNDCCGCGYDHKSNHMSGKFVLDTKLRLEQLDLVDADTRYIVNHFSHNGHMTHEQLEAHFNPAGIDVGFDGMEVYL